MRFKFACTCGKRLAAYSWMVGRVTECPKCHTTLTIPTPERAAEMLGEGGGELATRYRIKRLGRRKWTRKEWTLIVLVALTTLGVGFLLGCLYFRWPF